MTVNRWTITSREEWLERRKTNINGSEIGAAFGCSPFLSPYALYAEKAGLVISPDKQTKAMRRGRWYEPAVANMVQDFRPDWLIEKCTDYFWSDEWKLGCTPDYLVRCPCRGPGVLQTKSVARSIYDKEWCGEPPFWIVLQTLLEGLLTSANWMSIGALIQTEYDADGEIFEFERNAGAEAKLVAEAERFWADVAARRPPAPDYAVDDAVIKAIYPQDNGETIDLTGDNRMTELLDLREKLSAAQSAANKQLKTVNAEIADKIGVATHAIISGWKKVSFKTQTRKGYTVQDTSYRVLRAVRDDATPSIGHQH